MERFARWWNGETEQRAPDGEKAADPKCTEAASAEVDSAVDVPGTDGLLTLAQLVDMLNLGGVPTNKLSEATYFACLRILSEALGKLPLKLLRETEADGVMEERGDPLYKVLRYRPNPFETSTRFWSSVEFARNHYGNAYARIDGAGNRMALFHMASDRVQVWYDNRHILGQDTALWYIWTAENGIRYKLSSEEVLHFRTWLSMDGITGLAVQDILRLTLDGSLRAQQMQNKLYENGFTAKAAVQYTGDLSPEAERKFMAGLERYAQGQMDSVKSFIPLPFGSQLTPLNIKLTDGQFVELKKYSALQVAAAFGVKPNQVNDYEKSSYASAEAQQLAFLVDTLLWIVKDYEEEITFKLVPEERIDQGVGAEFNTAVILRADSKTQLESLGAAVEKSVYTPNEARRFIRLAKKPAGDELYATSGTIPLIQAGAQYSRAEEE